MKTRKNISVIIISLCAALCVAGCDGVLLDITKEALKAFGAQWARSVESDVHDLTEFDSVAVAYDGSVYAAGIISGSGTYDFGNGVTADGDYSAAGGQNVILVKYDSKGLAQWARTVLTGPDESLFLSVAVGPDGSVYACGSIDGNGTYDFGNGVYVAGDYDSFNNALLVKYSSNGTALWAKSVATGPSQSFFSSVAVGPDGNVYASGIINGTEEYTFYTDVTAQGNNSAWNLVLVKYSSSGSALWSRSVTGTVPDESVYRSVAVGSDGSVYAAGTIDGLGEYDLGNEVKVSGKYSDSGAYDNIIIVKYNSMGTALWARSVTEGTAQSRYYSVAVANDGSVYALGVIDGNETFNFGGNVTLSGYSLTTNMMLLKYNSSGIAQWACTPECQYSFGRSVTVSSDDYVYIAGRISGNEIVDFGNNVTVNTGTHSGAILVKYNKDGIALCARCGHSFSESTSYSWSEYYSISTGSGSTVYAAGYIYGTEIINFGDGVTASGIYESENALLVKYKE